jgi:putative zinc finger/helix-turn-helix YgiT family protein
MNREFSPRCGNCRERAVELADVPYSVTIAHDGRTYLVEIPSFSVPRCTRCGTIALDEEANRAITAAFRAQIGLLTPEEIRDRRTALGLSVQQLADHLGVAADALERWESGMQLQPLSLDRFLRAFFRLPELRRVLSEEPVPATS